MFKVFDWQAVASSLYYWQKDGFFLLKLEECRFLTIGKEMLPQSLNEGSF